MMGPSLYISVLVLASHVVAQEFSLYPTIDPVSLSKAFNISDDCLDALNTTLPCDPTLIQMSQAVDNYWWEADNLTALCTADCFKAVEAWDADVENRCYFDSLVAYNKIVPASSVSGRYSEGFHIACLTSGNSTDTSLDTSWCLVDSQEWVGSDFVRPDCTADPTNAFCLDPTNLDAESQRIANLYGDDVLCSECFIQMMYRRLTSPYLPDHDFSDYLVGEYLDILDVCNATNDMPELVIRAPFDYVTAIPPPLNLTNIPVDTVCTGQNIVKSSLDPNANCNSISQAFNAATGDVQAATGDPNCISSKASFCLQAPCTLYLVPSGATCDSLATAFSTTNLTVTTVQLLNWNENIIGLCDSLTPGQYVCASAPGGSYIPPVPPANSANDGGQVRGGGDGSSTNSTLPPTTTGLPSPVQTGIAAGCKLYAQAQPGDYCSKFADEFKITPAQLYQWNTALGVNGANCSTLFWANEWYCVSGPSAASSSSTTTSSSSPTSTSSNPASTTSAVAIPSPTQAGISPQCNKYAIAVSGDYCYIFAQNNGITTDQLYAWNTVLGTGGANCGSLFWANEYYCVGVSS